MSDSAAPFLIHRPAPSSESAVVFDTPHSGRVLPLHFKFSCSVRDLALISDPYVDVLLKGIPPRGSPVLEQQIHRACIDLNRNENEIDPAMVRGGWHKSFDVTHYTRHGLGLIPAQLGGRAGRLTPIFNEASRPTAEEIEARITLYHRPYYAALKKLLDRAHDKNGQSLHINMHSMRPFNPPVDIALGDLKGKSAAPDIMAFISNFFEAEGYSVALNKPFSGAALIQSTAQPEHNRHAVQIELARTLYLQPNLLDLDPVKAEKMSATLNRLAMALQDYMARRSPSPVPAPKT